MFNIYKVPLVTEVCTSVPEAQTEAKTENCNTVVCVYVCVLSNQAVEFSLYTATKLLIAVNCISSRLAM